MGLYYTKVFAFDLTHRDDMAICMDAYIDYTDDVVDLYFTDRFKVVAPTFVDTCIVCLSRVPLNRVEYLNCIIHCIILLCHLDE